MKNLINISDELRTIFITLNPTEKDLDDAYITLIDGNWKHDPSANKIKIFGNRFYITYSTESKTYVSKEDFSVYTNVRKVELQRYWFFFSRNRYYYDTSKNPYLIYTKTTPFDRTYYNYSIVFINN